MREGLPMTETKPGARRPDSDGDPDKAFDEAYEEVMAYLEAFRGPSGALYAAFGAALERLIRESDKPVEAAELAVSLFERLRDEQVRKLSH
jgi:hypothetical protein